MFVMKKSPIYSETFLVFFSLSMIFVWIMPTTYTEGRLLYAQGTKYPYDKYDDRKEGIVSGEELIHADADLELVSARIENSSTYITENEEEFHLGFYIPKDLRARVAVKEFKKLYLMELLRNDFTTGTFHFSWPSKIPNYYQIHLTDLSPLVKILPSSSQKIIPIVLYTRTTADTVVIYRFGVVPSRKVSLLEYSIYDAQTLNLVYTGQIRDLEADPAVSYILWNGRDLDNNKIQNGEYSLVVEATFQSISGSPAYRITDTYYFYHYNDLLKKLYVKE